MNRNKKSSKVELDCLSVKGGTRLMLNRNRVLGGERDHNAGIRNIATLSRVAVGGYSGICRLYL